MITPLRFIKREWKALTGVGVFVVLSVLAAHQLYRAWAYGEIVSPLSLSGWASYQFEPVGFVFGVAFNLLVALPSVGVLVLCGRWRSGERYFRRRESAPALDQAVRQPIDRKR